MFFDKWITASAIIFALIMTLSTALSVQKYFFLSPSARSLMITSWKFWKHFFFGILAFAAASALLGIFAAGMWEGINYYFFAEAVR